MTTTTKPKVSPAQVQGHEDAVQREAERLFPGSTKTTCTTTAPTEGRHDVLVEKVKKLEGEHKARLAQLQQEADALKIEIQNLPQNRLTRILEELVRLQVHGDNRLTAARQELLNSIPGLVRTREALEALADRLQRVHLQSCDGREKSETYAKLHDVNQTIAKLRDVAVLPNAVAEVQAIRRKYGLPVESEVTS